MTRTAAQLGLQQRPASRKPAETRASLLRRKYNGPGRARPALQTGNVLGHQVKTGLRPVFRVLCPEKLYEVDSQHSRSCWNRLLISHLGVELRETLDGLGEGGTENCSLKIVQLGTFAACGSRPFNCWSGRPFQLLVNLVRNCKARIPRAKLKKGLARKRFVF